MSEEIKITKKKKVVDIKKVPVIKLVSYTMKAVIPVGEYANIQPEIKIETDDVQAAKEFLINHIEGMFKDYGGGVPVYEKIENKEPKKNITIQPQPPAAAELSEAFKKAQKTLNSCLSLDAVTLVVGQIEKSVRLTDEEKKTLLNMSAIKVKELSENGNTVTRPS